MSKARFVWYPVLAWYHQEAQWVWFKWVLFNSMEVTNYLTKATVVEK